MATDFKEEIDWIQECKKNTADIKNITVQNIDICFSFEEFKESFLMRNNIINNYNDDNDDNEINELNENKQPYKRTEKYFSKQNIVKLNELNELDEVENKEQYIVGLNDPSIEIFPIKKFETKTIIKTIPGETKTIIKYQQQQPPEKKQRLSVSSDWKTGHNKPYNQVHHNNHNNNNNKSKRKREFKENENEKEKKDFTIPKGCESLFDFEQNLVEELANLDPKLVCQIGFDLMKHNLKVHWEDIAGLKKQKQKIKEIVVWPLQRRDLFVGLLEAPKGVLLFGPPGTGKTMIAKAIATESRVQFFSMSSSSLTSKWMGESEKLVKTLFSVARFMAPSIVFIDEIDSILSKRKSDGDNGMNRLKTQFLTEFQGANVSENQQNKYVLIIGATNRPQEIDEAARRRLSKRLYIPLPDEEGRKQLIINLLKKDPDHDLSSQQIQYIVEKTDGYSGSDMSDLCKEAALGKIREFNDISRVQKHDLRGTSLSDFEHALKETRATVATEELTDYIKWNKQFGATM